MCYTQLVIPHSERVFSGTTTTWVTNNKSAVWLVSEPFIYCFPAERTVAIHYVKKKWHLHRWSVLWFFSSKCRTQFLIAQFRHWTCIIEGFTWQPCWMTGTIQFLSSGKWNLFSCKFFSLFLPSNMAAMQIHYDGHLHVLHISTWPKQDAHSRTLIKV